MSSIRLAWRGRFHFASGTRVFAPSAQADAVHVAAAVTMGVPVLVPWRFRHLVNVARRANVNAVNASLGLGSIEIVAPPEVR